MTRWNESLAGMQQFPVTTTTLVGALGILILLVLLAVLLVLRARGEGHARQHWKNEPASWARTYRESMAHAVAHSDGLGRAHTTNRQREGDALSGGLPGSEQTGPVEESSGDT